MVDADLSDRIDALLITPSATKATSDGEAVDPAPVELARRELIEFFQQILDGRYDAVLLVARKAYLLFQAVRSELQVPQRLGVFSHRVVDTDPDAIRRCTRVALVDDVLYSGSGLAAVAAKLRDRCGEAEIDAHVLRASRHLESAVAELPVRCEVRRLASGNDLAAFAAASVEIIQRAHGAYLSDFPRYQLILQDTHDLATIRRRLLKGWKAIDLTTSSHADEGIESWVLLPKNDVQERIWGIWMSRCGIVPDSAQIRLLLRGDDRQDGCPEITIIPKIRFDNIRRSSLQEFSRRLQGLPVWAGLRRRASPTDRGAFYLGQFLAAQLLIDFSRELGLFPRESDGIRLRPHDAYPLRHLFGGADETISSLVSPDAWMMRRDLFSPPRRQGDAAYDTLGTDPEGDLHSTGVIDVEECVVGPLLNPVLSYEFQNLFASKLNAHGVALREDVFDVGQLRDIVGEEYRRAAGFDLVTALIAQANDLGISVPILLERDGLLGARLRAGENAMLSAVSMYLLLVFLKATSDGRTDHGGDASLPPAWIDAIAEALAKGSYVRTRFDGAAGKALVYLRWRTSLNGPHASAVDKLERGPSGGGPDHLRRHVHDSRLTQWLVRLGHLARDSSGENTYTIVNLPSQPKMHDVTVVQTCRSAGMVLSRHTLDRSPIALMPLALRRGDDLFARGAACVLELLHLLMHGSLDDQGLLEAVDLVDALLDEARAMCRDDRRSEAAEEAFDEEYVTARIASYSKEFWFDFWDVEEDSSGPSIPSSEAAAVAEALGALSRCTQLVRSQVGESEHAAIAKSLEAPLNQAVLEFAADHKPREF